MPIRTCWLPDCTAQVFSTQMPVFCSEACRTKWRELYSLTSPPVRLQKVIAPAPVPAVVLPITLTDADREQLRETGRRIAALVDAVRPAFEELARRINAACHWAADLADAIAPRPPKDPMQRALFLRQNRNTGPANPRPRAPRQLDTTARRRTR